MKFKNFEFRDEDNPVEKPNYDSVLLWRTQRELAEIKKEVQKNLALKAETQEVLDKTLSELAALLDQLNQFENKHIVNPNESRSESSAMFRQHISSMDFTAELKEKMITVLESIETSAIMENAGLITRYERLKKDIKHLLN